MDAFPKLAQCPGLRWCSFLMARGGNGPAGPSLGRGPELSFPGCKAQGAKEPPSAIFSGLDTWKKKSGNRSWLTHVKGLGARQQAGPLPRVILVTHLPSQLEGALDKGHEVTLEALPKDVLVSKEVMGAVLYFLGALTGK